MGHLDITPEVVAGPYAQMGALIGKGVAAVGTHQSALGIDTIEGALGAPEHIDTAQLIVVMVVSALTHQRQTVGVDAHGRAVDARAYAAYVYRAGVTRPVSRHRERGNVERQIAQVAEAHALQFATRKHGTAYGLLTETETLLGLRNDNHLVDVNHPRGVVDRWVIYMGYPVISYNMSGRRYHQRH